MRYFCTYFDSAYLTRGITLYRTLERWAQPFTLYVLYLDEGCGQVLARLDFPHIRLVGLEEIENADPALSQAKKNRTRVEYFFTLSPVWPKYLLDKYPAIDCLTYVDADLCFFSDPSPVEQETWQASLAIIAHRFSKTLEHLSLYGIYNVGWISFRRDETSSQCLTWWRERCLETCSTVAKDGNYADQKYLDEWPERFRNVAIIRHPGANLAPWNISNHCITYNGGRVLVDGEPLIFFHFHAFKQLKSWLFDTCFDRYHAKANAAVMRHIYRPYIALLEQAQALVSDKKKPTLTGYIGGWKQNKFIIAPVRKMVA